MTRAQFLADLEQLIATDSAYQGHFIADGNIRLSSYVTHRRMCPVTYAAWRRGLGLYDTSDYLAAGRALGLPAPLTRQLARAADNQGAPVLRQQILACCARARRTP